MSTIFNVGDRVRVARMYAKTDDYYYVSPEVGLEGVVTRYAHDPAATYKVYVRLDGETISMNYAECELELIEDLVKEEHLWE